MKSPVKLNGLKLPVNFNVGCKNVHLPHLENPISFNNKDNLSQIILKLGIENREEFLKTSIFILKNPEGLMEIENLFSWGSRNQGDPWSRYTGNSIANIKMQLLKERK